MGDQMPKFPSCFPLDFAEKILPQGLPPLKLDVFRVCTNGTINKESFLSTFETISQGAKPAPPDWEKRKGDPSAYSVSCNDTLEGARHPLKCLVQYHPAAILAHGTASSALGPLQRTADRKPLSRDKSHIDWWLYADSDPSPLFSQVEVSFEE